jgi:hypothetical protein
VAVHKSQQTSLNTLLLCYARGPPTADRMWGLLMRWSPRLAIELSGHRELRFGTSYDHPMALWSAGSLAACLSTCGFGHLETNESIRIMCTASTIFGQDIMGMVRKRLNMDVGNTIPPDQLAKMGIASMLIYDVCREYLPSASLTPLSCQGWMHTQTNRVDYPPRWVQALAPLKRFISATCPKTPGDNKSHGIAALACITYADKVFHEHNIETQMTIGGTATFNFNDAPVEAASSSDIFDEIDMAQMTFYNRRGHTRAIPARVQQLKQLPDSDKTFAVSLSIWLMECVLAAPIPLPTARQAEMMFSDRGVGAWQVVQQKMFFDGMDRISVWLGIRLPIKRRGVKNGEDEEGST